MVVGAAGLQTGLMAEMVGVHVPGAPARVEMLTADPDKPNTPLIRNIARRLAELLPGAADVPVIRSWAGVVEQAPDYRCADLSKYPYYYPYSRVTTLIPEKTPARTRTPAAASYIA